MEQPSVSHSVDGRARDIIGVGSSAAETKAWVARELPRWAKVIKAANMQVD